MLQFLVFKSSFCIFVRLSIKTMTAMENVVVTFRMNKGSEIFFRTDGLFNYSYIRNHAGWVISVTVNW